MVAFGALTLLAPRANSAPPGSASEAIAFGEASAPNASGAPSVSGAPSAAAGASNALRATDASGESNAFAESNASAESIAFAESNASAEFNASAASEASGESNTSGVSNVSNESGASNASGAAALESQHAAGGAEGDAGRAAALSEAQQLQSAFDAVIQRVAPSVVGIRAERRYFTDSAGGSEAGPARTVTQFVQVNGSGAIVDADGLILTNEHVVQSAGRIEVIFSDGSVLPARVHAADARSDLAILAVERRGLPPVRFCEWGQVARGQWSLTLGNPFGLAADGQPSVAVGVISNLNRRLPGLGESDDRLYQDMIQTTTPISPGNSGGPLFNLDGELIGIVTAMHTRGADDGVGFAIPLTPRRREMIAELMAGRPIEYAYLGLTVREPSPAERAARGLSAADESPGAVIIETLDPSGPASAAALQPGDLLTAVNGEPIAGPGRLADQLARLPVGRPAVLLVVRPDGIDAVQVTPGRREVSRVSWMRGPAVLWRGLRLAERREPSGGVRGDASSGGAGVVVLEAGGPAASDVAVGDVILEIEGEPVGDVLSLRERLKLYRGAVRVLVQGRGERVIQP